jgi:hypothetical protein
VVTGLYPVSAMDFSCIARSWSVKGGPRGIRRTGNPNPVEAVSYETRNCVDTIEAEESRNLLRGPQLR